MAALPVMTRARKQARRPLNQVSTDLLALVIGHLESWADMLHFEGVWVASTAIRGSGGSLDFIRIFQYKKQPNHFHTVLLYNRGAEPQTILFYHPGEVQVPQVPRMQGILVGHGSKLSATLDSDFPMKMPRAWDPRRTARGPKCNLCRPENCLSTRVHTRVEQF